MAKVFNTSTWTRVCAGALMCCVPLLFSAYVAAEQINLVTSHSESRLLTLLRDEAREQQLQLKAIFIDQEQLKSELFRSRHVDALPDVLLVPPDISNLPNLAIETLPSSWFLADLAPELAQQVPAVAAQKAIPFVVGNHLLQFYNKALVDQPLTGWDQLSPSYQTPIFSWSYNEMYWFAPFVLSKGVKFLHDGEPHLDTPEMIDALSFYKQLASRGVVNPNCNYSCSLARFVEGDVPYHINGTWAIEALSGHLGDNLGVALLPDIDGLPMRSYYSAYVIVFPALSRHSPEKLAALRSFARHVQSADFQVKLLQQGSQMPVNRRARQEFINSDDGLNAVFVKQLERSVIMPDSPEMVIVWDAMSRGFVRYSGGVLNAPAAARYMERTYQRFNR